MQLTSTGKIAATVFVVGTIITGSVLGRFVYTQQQQINAISNNLVIPRNIPLTIAPTVTATPSATATPTIKAVYYAPTKAIQK